MSKESNPDRSNHRMPANIVAGIAATPSELSRLEGELMARYGQTFSMFPLEVDAPLPLSVIAQSDILVIEIDPDVPASLSRIEAARVSDPDKRLIAAIPNMDRPTVRALVRRGVNDVISLPFDAEELFTAVVDLGSTLSPEPDQLAPMFGVVHSSGGAGASTILSHLAASIAANGTDTTCCVVDLDIQFGEIANLLGVDPAGNVVDCLDAGARLDFDIVSNALVEINPNLSVLGAPDEVMPPEKIDTDLLLKLLSILRQNFDVVFIDLPAGWSEATLSAACSCDEILVVVDQSVRSLARARKAIALLNSVDFPRSATKLVVNRAEKKLFQAIGTQEVSDALGLEVVAAIPLVKSGLQSLQEGGLLLTEQDPRAPFSKAIHSIADYLLEEGEG